MKQKFDITQLKRIEIDLTFFKFFNENKIRLDQLEYQGNPLYKMLYAMYILIDKIECNGIDWFLGSASDKAIFYDAIHFFAPEQKEDIEQLIHSHITKRTDSTTIKETILEKLIIALDQVQDKTIAWLQCQPNALLPILDNLQKIYTTFTLPIIQKSKA